MRKIMSNEYKAVPANCRQRLASEGKPYPRSGCASCGQMSPNWRECDSMLSRPVPQPPATELVAAGLNLQLIVTEALIGMIAAVTSTSPPANEPPPAFIQAGIDRAVSRISAHLAPLQAEIERQAAQFKDWQASHHANYVAAVEERDQLKARCDELEALLPKYQRGSTGLSGEVERLTLIAREAAISSAHRYSYMPALPEDAQKWKPHEWVLEAMRRVELAALSKPAASDQV